MGVCEGGGDQFVGRSSVVIFGILGQGNSGGMINPFFRSEGVRCNVRARGSLVGMVRLSAKAVIMSTRVGSASESVVVRSLGVEIETVKARRLLDTVSTVGVVLTSGGIVLPIGRRVASVSCARIRCGICGQCNDSVPVISLGRLAARRSIGEGFINGGTGMRTVGEAFKMRLSLSLAASSIGRCVTGGVFGAPE